MHVAIFHPAKLPVTKYGGTERIVVWLARGLAKLGHRVTLIAGRGTNVPEADVVEVDVRKAIRHDFSLTPHLPATVDLVHYFVPIHEPSPIPHLWTMQGNGRPGFDPGERCVFVSQDHARRHGSRSFVYNGIDTDEYEFRDTKEDYLLFLGRLHGVKGWRDAISVAKLTERRIVLAGGWRPGLSPSTRFAGRVGGKRKTDLLAGARVLIMPVTWPEPFGIVVLEAWASGTPVVARPRGALPELVRDGTGGLAEKVSGMADLVNEADRWDAHTCRARAEEFSHLVMAERYVEQYRHLLEHGTLKPVIE